MADYYTEALAAMAEETRSTTDYKNCSSRSLFYEPEGGLDPLLTVRTSSCFGDYAAGGTVVACLRFLSPSILAAGDSAGCVSFIDLLTRRPLASFAAAASYSGECSSSMHRKRESSVSGSHTCRTNTGNGKKRLSWKDVQKLQSPLLQMSVIEGSCEASAPSDAADFGAAVSSATAESEVDRAASAEGRSFLQKTVEERWCSTRVTEKSKTAIPACVDARGSMASGRQLLLQQKSSLVSLWDVEHLTPSCRFSTGACSFCKFALLQEPKQQQWQQRAPCHTQREITEQHEQRPRKQKDTSLADGSKAVPTDGDGVTAVGAGALLMAAPVADPETVGIFDLRCCQESFSTKRLSCSGSNIHNSADVIAHTALALKPSAAVASAWAAGAFPDAVAAAGGREATGCSLGVVHALTTGASSTSSYPLLLAAYEYPCVALWDLRNNTQPLCMMKLPSPAVTSLPRPASATVAAPPSCMALYRNQCWIGSYEGDLWVLKLNQRTRTLSAPVLTTNLVSSVFETTHSTHSLTRQKKKANNVSQQLHCPREQVSTDAQAALVSRDVDLAAASAASGASRASATFHAAVDVAASSSGGAASSSADSTGSSAGGNPTLADGASSSLAHVVANKGGGASAGYAVVTGHTSDTSVQQTPTPLTQQQLVLRSTNGIHALIPPTWHACVLRLPHPDGDIGRQHALLCTAFRPDGAIVGVGTANGTLHLFEAKSRGCLGTLRQEGAEIKALAWCPQTGVLAASGPAGRVALWGLYVDSYSLRK